MTVYQIGRLLTLLHCTYCCTTPRISAYTLRYDTQLIISQTGSRPRSHTSSHLNTRPRHAPYENGIILLFAHGFGTISMNINTRSNLMFYRCSVASTTCSIVHLNYYSNWLVTYALIDTHKYETTRIMLLCLWLCC